MHNPSRYSNPRTPCEPGVAAPLKSRLNMLPGRFQAAWSPPSYSTLIDSISTYAPHRFYSCLVLHVVLLIDIPVIIKKEV